MRVVLVCPYDLTVPGGVQAHVAGLAGALRERGHDVTVSGPSGWTVPVPDNGSVVRVALDPVRAATTARAVRGRDVVHVHEPALPWVGIAATLAAAGPLVGTFHMSAPRPGWYRVFRPLVEPLLDRLDVRVAVSESARRHVARTLGGDYRVIPNGVDLARLAASTDGGRSGRVLFVGRPEPRKGLPVLLEALRRLPDAEADLVGPGPGSVPSDLRGRVRAHGRVADGERDRLLAEAAVLCAPATRGESFGIVLVEAMAAGTPVVASAIPGYVDVLPLSAGRLVPPGDAAALAAALAELLGDEELRRRLGAAGREAARRFDWPLVADAVLAAYADAGAT